MRRALAGLTVFSFLLSIVIGGLWVRSYAHLDLITHREKNELHDHEYLFAASQGRVICSYIHRLSDPRDVPPVVSELRESWNWHVEDPILLRTGDSLANHYGFTAVASTEYSPPKDDERGATWTKYGFVVPCWFLFGLSLILPGLSWHRGRRRAAGNSRCNREDLHLSSFGVSQDDKKASLRGYSGDEAS
jgi:hypothetical protein